jgi:2-polyprenyl-3-methyl-5-hydroxy-6-metoxy-1,4-benzoquinol methylase
VLFTKRENQSRIVVKEMVRNDCSGIVKKEFDFGWKAGGPVRPTDLLALEYQKGDILDVGCGTCQLYSFLNQTGWTGRYVGIDERRYEGYPYPTGVELVVGDTSTLTFPKTDTVVLYNVLEHVEDPCALLSKSVESCQKNVLVHIPKRNEALWEHGVVEYHQLDKTHQHCGFSKEEVDNIVRLSGGKIRSYKEVSELNATVGISLWNSRIPKGVVLVLSKIFSAKTFYRYIWCEVVKDDDKDLE